MLQTKKKKLYKKEINKLMNYIRFSDGDEYNDLFLIMMTI